MTTRPAPDRFPLTRIAAKSAAEPAAPARLGRKALGLLRPDQGPREYLEALVGASLYPDAVRFLAFALPIREAVWWACLHTLMSEASRLHREDTLALEAVARWVAEPTEEHRRQAEARAGQATAAGLAARAVTLTGGSLRPPPLPHIPPGPEFPRRGVSRSITRGVTAGKSGGLPDRYRQAVALGMQIARGRWLWAAVPRTLTASGS